jgi:hypothetical protein
MNKAVLISLMALTLGACNETRSREAQPGEYDPRFNAYFQDPRTKLCFAASVYDRTDVNGKAASGVSHTMVPCSAEVMALLTKLPQ